VRLGIYLYSSSHSKVAIIIIITITTIIIKEGPVLRVSVKVSPGTKTGRSRPLIGSCHGTFEVRPLSLVYPAAAATAGGFLSILLSTHLTTATFKYHLYIYKLITYRLVLTLRPLH
jgi:hypothetical protein